MKWEVDDVGEIEERGMGVELSHMAMMERQVNFK